MSLISLSHATSLVTSREYLAAPCRLEDSHLRCFVVFSYLPFSFSLRHFSSTKLVKSYKLKGKY